MSDFWNIWNSKGNHFSRHGGIKSSTTQPKKITNANFLNMYQAFCTKESKGSLRTHIENKWVKHGDTLQVDALMQRQVSGSTKPGDVSKLVFAKSGWECERSAKASKISERVPPGPPGSEIVYFWTEIWSVHTVRTSQKIRVSPIDPTPALHEFILATKLPIALDSLEPTESFGAKACHSPATLPERQIHDVGTATETICLQFGWTSDFHIASFTSIPCASILRRSGSFWTSCGLLNRSTRWNLKERLAYNGAKGGMWPKLEPSALRLLLPVDRGHQ